MDRPGAGLDTPGLHQCSKSKTCTDEFELVFNYLTGLFPFFDTVY